MNAVEDANLTDAEVARMCRGLKQPAAMVRHLRNQGLPVLVDPRGFPVVPRAAYQAFTAAQAQNATPAASKPVADADILPEAGVVALRDWANRRTRRGTKA